MLYVIHVHFKSGNVRPVIEGGMLGSDEPYRCAADRFALPYKASSDEVIECLESIQRTYTDILYFMVVTVQ